jgi:hypothetical protein
MRVSRIPLRYIASRPLLSTGESMTPEEINQTMEFILQQQANFWAGMEELKAGQREQERSLQAFKKQVAQFTTWAAETCAIQSRRLDEHDQQFEQRERQFKEQLEEQKLERQAAEKHRQEEEQFRRDVMRALNLILNRLFPSNN